MSADEWKRRRLVILNSMDQSVEELAYRIRRARWEDEYSQFISSEIEKLNLLNIDLYNAEREISHRENDR